MAFENTSTENLLLLRANMIGCAVKVATDPAARGEPRAMAKIQVLLVDIIDVTLTGRGVEFTPPVWR